MTMRVFTDDVYTYVAADLDAVKKLWAAQTGAPEYFEPDNWSEVSPDTPLTIWCNDKGEPDEPLAKYNTKITKTAAEWAAALGVGFLCSTEY